MREVRIDNLERGTETEKVIIDSGLFKACEQVEGLAFIKSYSSAVNKNEKDYVRMYFKDKNYKTFQGNLTNINTQVLTTVMLDDMVGKVCFLKGVVNPFLGMNIVNIERLDVCTTIDLTEQDFIPTIPNIEELQSKLKEQIKLCTTEYTEACIDFIYDQNIAKLLGNSFMPSIMARRGAALATTIEMLNQLQFINDNISKINGLEFKKCFIIISMGVISMIETGKATKPKLLDTRNLVNYKTVTNLLNTKNAFGRVYKQSGELEFNHLYNCIFNNETPKTFIVKFFVDSYKHYKNVFDYALMDENTFENNRRYFDNQEHIKLGGE